MLIPFPNVPIAAGVPNLSRVSLSSPPQQSLNAPNAQPTIPQVQQWAIANSSGNSVLTFDAMLAFEYRGEMKIPTYPIEQGGFAGFNKVTMPIDARMVVTCNGHGALTRTQFLAAVETYRKSLDLLTIVTPDIVYANMNLVHADYQRRADHGVSMLTVDLWFQEVMNGGLATTSNNTAQPDGASPTQAGDVTPIAANTSQQAAYGNIA